ncbi:MAG: ABC transporter ATP-binding protein [Syntrophomonadaceae bacterium]|nr:ABC transporter ATP-binding protein [Syntrophomonadaceae bacterium]
MNLQRESRQLVSNLSVGYKQRLALASAIIAKPQVLFLDEPTSGVSPTSRRNFFDIIQNLSDQGTTVIVTTHFMDEAERCDTIAFLSAGKLLAFDNPDSLKKNSIKGILVELHLPEPMGHIDKLTDLPYVSDCFIHGSLLHVLVADQEGLENLKKEVNVPLKIIKPSLDDVFIALAKKR